MKVNGFTIHLYAAALDGSPTPRVGAELMTVAFEDFARQVESWPRMFFEYDGSFVWTGDDEHGQLWQLDGMAYDIGGWLQRLELKGWIPIDRWRELLGTVGWPSQQFTVHDLQSQLLMDVQAFTISTWSAPL